MGSKYIFNSYSPQTWFWGEIVCAVTKVISDASARILYQIRIKRKTAIGSYVCCTPKCQRDCKMVIWR